MIKQVTLNSVLSFHRGITFKPDDKVQVGSDGSVVCFRTKNIQKELDERDLISVPSSFVRREELYVKQGDILISTANSWELVGKCVRIQDVNYKSTIGGFISLLRPNLEVIDPDYLYRFISMKETQHRVRHLGKQTTNISNLDRVRFLELEIPLPSLETQKQIAAVLEKADQLRKDCQQVEQELNSLAQSVFIDMFGDPDTNPKGWEVRELGSLVPEGDRINYGVVQPGQFENEETGVPLIRISDFDKGQVSLKKIKYISHEVEAKYKRSRIIGDEVLIACVGATIGKTAIVSSEHEGFNVARAVTRVRVDDAVNRYFLQKYLESDFVQNFFVKETRSVGQPTLNTSLISRTSVLIPDKKSQGAFLKFSEKNDEQIVNTKNLMKELELQFTALMQKAFKGELNLHKSAA